MDKGDFSLIVSGLFPLRQFTSVSKTTQVKARTPISADLRQSAVKPPVVYLFMIEHHSIT